MVRRYEFAPGLALSVEGNRAVVRHFDAEYASAVSVAPSGPVTVEVRFGAAAHGVGERLRGGHKTVRWQIRLSSPDTDPIRAAITLAGRPRSFGLSLVQGYVVEPLLSIAAARRGRVLLPAAAFSEGDRTLVIMGRSRSGKSSVATLALVAGRTLHGDDQVLLEEPCGCRPFPRRLRVYPDLRRTVPSAHAALSAGNVRKLTLLGIVDAVSRGYVRPPLRVQPAELGRVAHSSSPIARVVFVERAHSTRELSVAALEPDAVVKAGVALLEEQRAMLGRVTDRAWAGALAEAAEAETLTLRRALDRVPAERISVPETWGAERAIGALAERLGL
jgi:hypothetical protein